MNRFFFNASLNKGWLTALRIGTGLILLMSFLCIIPDLRLLYAEDGMADYALLKLKQAHTPFHFDIPAGEVWIWVIYLTCCLVLVIGFYARLSSLVLLVLHHQFFISQPVFSYGFDYITSSCLFYCLIFSLNPLWNTFYARILQLHVCIIYFFAGFEKLLGPTWRNGEALWKALTQPGFESIFKPDLSALAMYPWLWAISGWVVLLLEICYPLFIWLRPTRRYWLWCIVGLHVGIALFLGLYFFSAIMVLLNLAAFYYPYLPPLATQTPVSIPPMVSPLSPPAQGPENPAQAAG